MDSFADWFGENGLVINLKKGNIEFLLFGTSQRIAKQIKSLDVRYLGSKIMNSTQYKYLGIEIDLNINTHFENCVEHTSSRLRLLAKIKDKGFH